MRSIVVLLVLFLSREGLAQDCSALIREDQDVERGTISRSSTENIIISNDGKDSLSFVILELDKVIIFSVTVTGAGDCIDEKNKMTVTFRDGSKVELMHGARYNCDREFEVFLSGALGTKSQLQLFKTKEIQSVRVETRKSSIDKTRKNFVEQTFPAEQSKVLMQTVGCLIR